MRKLTLNVQKASLHHISYTGLGLHMDDRSMSLPIFFDVTNCPYQYFSKLVSLHYLCDGRSHASSPTVTRHAVTFDYLKAHENDQNTQRLIETAQCLANISKLWCHSITHSLLKKGHSKTTPASDLKHFTGDFVCCRLPACWL